jgi:hypothetical protein
MNLGHLYLVAEAHLSQMTMPMGKRRVRFHRLLPLPRHRPASLSLILLRIRRICEVVISCIANRLHWPVRIGSHEGVTKVPNDNPSTKSATVLQCVDEMQTNILTFTYVQKHPNPIVYRQRTWTSSCRW